MFAEDISEDFSDLTLTGIYSISGYLRNLRGRLLSSEKFSEVFTLWVFTLKPFPESVNSPILKIEFFCAHPPPKSRLLLDPH